MKDKYKMTVEQNIFLVKRNIIDYIWKSANLEGVNITFPETKQIYEKGIVNGLMVDDILVVNNLKHGWDYVLSDIGNPLTLNTLCNIQREVARDQALVVGALRSGTVGISGTEYVPPIPQEDNVTKELESILNESNTTEKAIDLMLWGMRSQLFWDGNKRTSMLAANKLMIEGGCGCISIKQNNMQEFSELLSDYYTTGNKEKVKNFIYEKCVEGFDFDTELTFNRKNLSQTEDKFNPGKPFYTITLPKGTALNGEDVSGCTIHPKEIRESEGNPDEILAVFHKDGSLPCLINLNKEGINLKRVDVEELKIAVDLQRNNEVELQRERAEEKNNTLEHNKNTDKGEGLE